jgi:hypothetical protein
VGEELEAKFKKEYEVIAALKTFKAKAPKARKYGGFRY